jgi:hypothetical protein
VAGGGDGGVGDGVPARLEPLSPLHLGVAVGRRRVRAVRRRPGSPGRGSFRPDDGPRDARPRRERARPAARRGAGATAELQIGTSAFVIRSRPAEGAATVELSRGLFRLFSRGALAGLQLAVVGSVFFAIPDGQTIGDRAMARPPVPRAITPWEAEKWLRVQAQMQARSLHQCFDPLPVACQHSGYVGVGVSLSRDGEMRSNWIARSTYGSDCPVDQCMKDVVSSWTFDPLPEAMRVVLPVQVLRTEKPLPPKVAEARVGADPTSTRADAARAGGGCPFARMDE